MRRKPLALCSIAVLVSLSVAWASAATRTQAPKSVEEFLSAFAGAAADSDVEQGRSLFLPPDDSTEGQSRAAHIKELEKDWTRAKAKGESISLSFGEPETQRITIKTVMRIQGSEESKPEAVPAEFTLQRTDDGFKIVSFETLRDR